MVLLQSAFTDSFKKHIPIGFQLVYRFSLETRSWKRSGQVLKYADFDQSGLI